MVDEDGVRAGRDRLVDERLVRAHPDDEVRDRWPTLDLQPVGRVVAKAIGAQEAVEVRGEFGSFEEGIARWGSRSASGSSSTNDEPPASFLR